jgi:hypothetical protein
MNLYGPSPTGALLKPSSPTRGTREQPGFVDVLGGFQYWHERYVAFGATSAFPSAVGTISAT